ncbi:MAG: hypothetical protein ACD_37C00234G0005 [uncultured bacterium]|nr:MAG: hypothetical protein ACD_37C00234G0005 [uncultured bacterium]
MEDYSVQIKDTAKKLLENTEEYVREKRLNFQNCLILMATILGFSVGLSQGKETSFITQASWIFQILTIFIGTAYLILEAESRYYRNLNQGLRYMLLLQKAQKGGILEKEDMQEYVLESISHLTKGGEEKTIKERLYILFANYIGKIQLIFYASFFLALLTLTLGVVINKNELNFRVYTLLYLR